MTHNILPIEYEEYLEEDRTNTYITVVGILFLIAFIFSPLFRKETPVISPLPCDYQYVSPTPTPTKLMWKGEASYYSRAGCLGCSPTLTMANGETLDDSRRTIAMIPEDVRTHHLLNKTVTITNNASGTTATARVTDTGGFKRYSRIADLSLATKVALGCADVCEVTIALAD